MEKNIFYRRIPKVDILLEQKEMQLLITQYGRDVVMDSIREMTDHLRDFIGICEDEQAIEQKMNGLTREIIEYVTNLYTPNMRPVINATGTILHTNLGRAPISPDHAEKIMRLVAGYSNLEYDLEAGKRGERYAHFEKLLCRLTGAEAAMAVNNNASAVMLVLSSLAKGGEVIVSRGELVEIGGKFRVPDVMEQSGAALVEIGTTNKTHFSDYKEAVTEQTKAFLKVHTSNYSIVGFTESVPIARLKSLSEERNIPIIEDLGSGVLVDFSKYGVTYEPTVQDILRAGADVVCFSGDKLLGGPQAGIIVGKKKYIEEMKKNQLTRALRIDKFTAAALELVLREYLCEEKAVQNIPVLRMICEPFEDVKKRAQTLRRMLKRAGISGDIDLAPCESKIGGGSLPLERIPSMAVTIKPEGMSVPEAEEAMRHLAVPIIPRVINDLIHLDMRTVEKRDLNIIVKELEDLL